MLFKFISSLFISTFLFLGLAQASPALEEKREFCQLVGGNAAAAAEARQKLNMPVDEFQARALQYYMNLLSNGVPEDQAEALMEGVLNGWNSPVSPELAGLKEFEKCMTKENI